MQVRTLESFNALRAAAPQLAEDRGAGDIFQTMAWFENLAGQCFAPPARLRLLLAEDAASASAVCLPLVSQGHTLQSLSNYYSSLYGPIGSGDQATVWEAICRHLRALDSPAIIDLRPLDAESIFFRDMLAALAAAGYWSDSYLCFGNWYLNVPSNSFRDYFATRSSRLRNNIQRGQRKLDKAGPWQLSIHKETGASLDSAIADFIAVYERSWKQPEPYPNFIGSLCRMATAQGWLRLGVLSLQDRPIAAQLWLVRRKKAAIYKLAYDQAESRFSPGSILTAALMEHVIEQDGVEEVDYLTGDDDYKKDWMSHRRERRGIIAFDPRTMRGLLSGARHFGARRIRKLMRDRSSHSTNPELAP